MKIADLRIQATTPGGILPNVVGLYANTGGVICTIASGGAPVQVGGTYTGVLTNNQIKTGSATYINTGIWFGDAAGATLQTGLSTPRIWLAINYNGTGFAIPAYALS